MKLSKSGLFWKGMGNGQSCGGRLYLEDNEILLIQEFQKTEARLGVIQTTKMAWIAWTSREEASQCILTVNNGQEWVFFI